MNETLFPDFGLNLLQSGFDKAIVFSSVTLFHLSRIESDQYSTTVTHRAEKTCSLTIDFSQEAFEELLFTLPPREALQLKAFFLQPFTGLEMLELESPIQVGTEAILGKPQQNQSERYVPLVAIRVFDATAPVTIYPGPLPTRQYFEAIAPRRLNREQDVVLIQTEEALGVGQVASTGILSATMLVLSVFANAQKSKKARWLAFIGPQNLHHLGLSLWIGLSKNVPTKIIEEITGRIKGLGAHTSAEMGNAAREDLLPLVYYDDEAFELLVPARSPASLEDFAPVLAISNHKATARRCLW